MEKFYSEKELLIMILERNLIKAIEKFEEQQAGAIEALADETWSREDLEKEIISEALSLVNASHS